jgi:hypothetical protein
MILLVVLNMCFHFYLKKNCYFFKCKSSKKKQHRQCQQLAKSQILVKKKNLNIFKSTEWNYYQDHRTFTRFLTGSISVQGGNLTINQLQATSQ